MRSAILYVVAAACIALIVSVAWWTREVIGPPPNPSAVDITYTAQSGDTVGKVAQAFQVSPEALVEANPSLARLAPPAESVTAPLKPGQAVAVPTAPPSLWSTWGGHLGGIGAEIVGVLASFWLTLLTRILPRKVRRQVLGISIVIGLVSYASTHAVGPDPYLTPQFVFASLKDGFMWAAAFPMVARGLGIKDDAPPPPDEPVEATPA